jgi:hypothetical protein
MTRFGNELFIPGYSFAVILFHGRATCFFIDWFTGKGFPKEWSGGKNKIIKITQIGRNNIYTQRAEK